MNEIGHPENEMTNSRIVILLTATITPNTFDTLVLSNPEERRSQYLNALHFYLKHTNYSLVFVENSGESIKDHFIDYENRIEFLSFTSIPSTETEDKGKGLKEMEIINFAIIHSERIRHAKVIIKITGRLKVLNINRITVDFLKVHHSLKLVSGNIYKIGKIDSRCFIFATAFWPYLKERGEFVNLKYSFESALWDAIKNFCISNQGIYRGLSRPLRIQGVSGGFGTAYNHGFFMMMVRRFKHFYLSRFKYREIFRKN